MTIDEAIKQAEEIVEDNQKVVDTHRISDEITLEEIYCDDTEIIEERLANSQKRADDFRQLAEWLKELKTLREQTRWIPVSERLPEESGDYLITFALDIGAKNPVREVCKDYFCEFSEEWLYYGEDVTAWMPLPKPYKEESEIN